MRTSAQQRSAKRFNKDRADVLMRLAEFRLARQHRRRDYEWRVSLGVWVALISALVTVKQPPKELLLGAMLSLTVIVHFLLWVMPLARRNRFDMQMAFFFADRAAQMVAEGFETKSLAPLRKSPSKDPIAQASFWFGQSFEAVTKDAWSGLFPIVVTLGLALMDWSLIGSAAVSPKPLPIVVTVAPAAARSVAHQPL